ncbi:hypothetical protein HZP54_18490 [Elizabethkingia anophelis]|nr:hypothetical protein [Elizabethkingia anophelis]
MKTFNKSSFKRKRLKVLELVKELGFKSVLDVEMAGYKNELKIIFDETN